MREDVVGPHEPHHTARSCGCRASVIYCPAVKLKGRLTCPSRAAPQCAYAPHRGPYRRYPTAVFARVLLQMAPIRQYLRCYIFSSSISAPKANSDSGCGVPVSSSISLFIRLYSRLSSSLIMSRRLSTLPLISAGFFAHFVYYLVNSPCTERRYSVYPFTYFAHPWPYRQRPRVWHAPPPA